MIVGLAGPTKIRHWFCGDDARYQLPPRFAKDRQTHNPVTCKINNNFNNNHYSSSHSDNYHVVIFYCFFPEFLIVRLNKKYLL